MWKCVPCGERVEANFEICWNCGRDRKGRVPKGPPRAPTPKTLRCDHCTVDLTYAGRKAFHEGAQWGVFGNLAELFENREHFDVYFCPSCGKVELFVVGVGRERRARGD